MQMTIPLITDEPAFQPTVIPAVASVKSKGPKADAVEARMWNEKGNLLFRAGAVDDAIRAYNKAIKADHGFGWSYCNLGIAYLHLRKFAEAVLLLQKSLELLTIEREQAVAWNELGNLYRCLNDYHNAIEAYRRADELDPDHTSLRDTVEYLHADPNAGNAQVWNELGNSFFKAGAYAEASDCYRKAADMEPGNGWAFSNLALSLALQSKFEEAVPLYLKSIELFKEDKEKADAWNRLGNVYRRLNDYDNAIAAYQHAVQLNNENASLLTRARFSLLGNCHVD
jgi:superkiller protein 3